METITFEQMESKIYFIYCIRKVSYKTQIWIANVKLRPGLQSIYNPN